MKPETIDLVRASWKKVETPAPHVAALFYHHLFAADPNLKALFKGDMAAQGRKLVRMIGLAVSRLDAPHELGPVLYDLAQRHVGYGVQAAHYATVEEALLATLRQGLGEDFTPAVQEAWTGVYNLMAEAMIAATQPATISAPLSR